MNEKVLNNLIKTRKVLKQKYKSLLMGAADTTNRLEKTFQPLTNPINKLIENVKLNEEKNVNLLLRKNIKPDKAEYSFLTAKSSTPFNRSKYDSSYKYLNHEDTTDDNVEGEENEFKEDLNNTKFMDDNDDDYKSSQQQLQHSTYASNISNLLKRKELDQVYGPHKNDSGQWRYGDSSFSIDDGHFIIGNRKWLLTPGLFQLLFHKAPKNYDDTELKIYRDILINSNAHKRGYKSNGQIKGTRGEKYTKIIKKLLHNPNKKTIQSNGESTFKLINNSTTFNNVPNTEIKNEKLDSPTVKGTGIMRLPRGKFDYVYWDDPNELVRRLQLLMASKLAGNNNHHNEIVSIIEELKEASIIK